MRKTLKTIACLKILRGGVAIAVGVSFIIAHFNWQANSWGDGTLLGRLASNDPFFQLLTHFLGKLTKEQILSIGVLALSLGGLRWIEACGIWLRKNWACYLAVITGLVYIPFEINELLNQFSWVIFAILTINLIVVIYLIHVLRVNSRESSL